MKNKFATLAAATALALTGCAATTTTAPEEAAPAENTSTSYQSVEDEFYEDFLSEAGSAGYRVSRQELIGMGREVCSLLDEGNSVGDILDAISDTAEDEDVITAMLALTASSVVNFCPEYAGSI